MMAVPTPEPEQFLAPVHEEWLKVLRALQKAGIDGIWRLHLVLSTFDLHLTSGEVLSRLADHESKVSTVAAALNMTRPQHTTWTIARFRERPDAHDRRETWPSSNRCSARFREWPPW
jgi:hypothetical protein